MNLPFTRLKAIKELNLPGIIQSYQIELKQNSSQNHYVGLCPFHDDSNPSFHVSFKNTKWIWHCFGCHASGNALDFVIKKEGVSFIKAYQKLNKLVGKEIHKPSIQKPVKFPLKDGVAQIDGVAQKHGNTFQRQDKSSLLHGDTYQQHGKRVAYINKPELLKKITDYYHNTFKENPRGAEYLRKRGIINPDIYKDYQLGFVDGSMKNTLNPETTQHLKQIGILNDKGNETFYNCVIFPISDEDGNIVSFYGRNIEPFDTLRARRQSHLYLAGKHQGVFNGQVLKTNKTIILTESIIDCVSLIQLGINNAVPLYGTNGLTPDHVQLFRNHLTKEILLCLDNDESGRNASKRLEKEFGTIGIATTEIRIPDVKDLNDYILSGRSKKEFDCLVTNIRIIKSLSDEYEKKSVIPAQACLSVDREGVPRITAENNQLHFNFKERQYRLRGFNVNRLDQLRVNIKVTNGENHHLDTFDLYNARARENFITQTKKTLNLENGSTGSPDAGHIHRDLSFIVDHLENLQSKNIDKDSSPAEAEYEITDVDRADALGLLKSKNLFDQILTDFKACGHIGEENNLLFGYLAGISRKLATPLAVLVISRSASGKTALQDAILSFTPPEDYEKYTRMTDQALFYKGEDSLKNKLLAIEEEKGATGCAYSLRNLQSSGGLSIATTTKDSITGKLKTDVYKVHGPTAIMITTTASEEADFETYNRFIILSVDESIEQTRRILERQRLNESIEGIIAKRNRDRIQVKHHNAQRLLKTLEVANPYSRQLTFIDTILRARREQPKYLALIKTVALLRQYQKEIKTFDNGDQRQDQKHIDGVAQKRSNTYQQHAERVAYIEVDLKDIEIANRIANEILGRNLDELCPPARNLIIEIKRMIDEIAEREGMESHDVKFNRRDIREFTKWSDYQIRCHLKQLEELEYIYPVKGSPGRQYSYKLLWDGQGKDGKKFFMGLVDVNKLYGNSL